LHLYGLGLFCLQEEFVAGRYFRRILALVLVALALCTAFVPSALAQDGGRKVRVKVTPVYPDLARKMNISGTVKIEVTIAPNGTVKATKVVGGHPLLVNAALDAIKKWKFEPGDETTQVVAFNFNSNE
jgi:TonB family protein